MTAKKTTTAKPVTVNPSVMAELAHARVDHDRAESLAESSKEKAQHVITTLKKGNVKIGDLRKCAFAQSFKDEMLKQVNLKTGKPYNLQSIKNMLVDIRFALDNNKPLVWNVSRKNAPKPAKGTSTVNNASVSKDDKKPSKVENITAPETDQKGKQLTPEDKLVIMLKTCLHLAQEIENENIDVITLQDTIKRAQNLLP